MTTFHTLGHLDPGQIATVFNEAFSDYLIPIRLTPEQLADKVYAEDIRLEHSVGAFENGRLVGFILHGIRQAGGQTRAYNAATGVVPGSRGRRLVEGMYRFILPRLKEQGVDRLQLEVLVSNTRAIRAYEQIGYRIIRQLACFKGPLTGVVAADHRRAEPLRQRFDWGAMQACWDFEPTWQHAPEVAENLKDSCTALGIYEENTLAAYVLMNPKTNRILQFGVAPPFRRQGLGRALFARIAAQTGDPVILINIENSAVATTAFVTSLGLSPLVDQYEMVLDL